MHIQEAQQNQVEHTGREQFLDNLIVKQMKQNTESCKEEKISDS